MSQTSITRRRFNTTVAAGAAYTALNPLAATEIAAGKADGKRLAEAVKERL